MAIFDNSTAFRDVSEETKELCRQGSGRLKKRDPAMYGDHHKCNKCAEPAKYIAKDTHWCRYCLDTVEYPHLANLSQEQRDAIRAENLGNVSGAKLVNVGNIAKIGF